MAAVLLDDSLRSLVEMDACFERICCLHRRGRWSV